MADDSFKYQKQFIYLLLNNKDLVSDWTESILKPKHFYGRFSLIFTAIQTSYENDVILTRRSFFDLVKKMKKPQDRAEQETLFNSCLQSVADPNDFPLLTNNIFEDFLMRNTQDQIEKFVKDSEKRGITFAVGKLSSSLQELSTDSAISSDIIYDDLRSFSQEKINYIRGVRSGEIKEPPRILCGIEEIDETMGVGYKEGTLTLFCADAGGFKSCAHNTLIPLASGGKKTVEELYDMQERGEELAKIISLDNNGKIVKQRPLKILDHGIMPCVKFKTKRGFEIINTLKHRHLLLQGYERTENIKIGDSLAISRCQFFGNKKPKEGISIWLGCMISDGGTSQPGYRFTNFDKQIVLKMKESTIKIGGGFSSSGYTVKKIREGQFNIKGTRKYGIQYKIDGKTALQKSIPEQVFSWNRENIVEFLKAMYGCDGSIFKREIKRKSGNISKRYTIQYHTFSKELAIGVRDLLIKFGIVASLFDFPSSYKNNGVKIEKGTAYRVMIRDSRQVEKFIKEIGFLGIKQDECNGYLDDISLIKENPNGDVIPSSIWSILDEKFKYYGKSFYGCRRYLRSDGKKGRGYEGHCGNRGKAISRGVLNKIVGYLDNDKELLSIVNSDIYW
ncbi:MAG: hypothetical protein J7L15_02525, partial [Clostridiales bacterium]|nr:hypothetical protein [Clostridiales bacterium]